MPLSLSCSLALSHARSLSCSLSHSLTGAYVMISYLQSLEVHGHMSLPDFIMSVQSLSCLTFVIGSETAPDYVVVLHVLVLGLRCPEWNG